MREYDLETFQKKHLTITVTNMSILLHAEIINSNMQNNTSKI